MTEQHPASHEAPPPDTAAQHAFADATSTAPAEAAAQVDPDVDGLVAPADADPDTPWAMQVALRYDKAALPTEDAVCEVTARAVVTFLTDPRTTDGVWCEPTTHWVDGRIRKLVRRARGVRWENVQHVPGVTVVDGAAAARVLVPQPARPLRKEVDDLQVSGTTFPAGPGRARGDEVVTVGISPLIEMTSGKVAAQCGHAAQMALVGLAASTDPADADVLARWAADEYRVRVVRPTRDEWAGLRTPVQIIDAGFTELDGPTETTRAWW